MADSCFNENARKGREVPDYGCTLLVMAWIAVGWRGLAVVGWNLMRCFVMYVCYVDRLACMLP